MDRRTLLTLTGTAAANALAGCTGSEGGATQVEAVDRSFRPARVAVETGATVEWLNGDPVAHTVTSAQFHETATDWSFDSGRFAQGETVTYTFENAGVYEYRCTVHGKSQMCGVVLVGGATLDAELPCPTGETTDDGGGDGY